MITWIRTAQSLPGKNVEAVTWAKQIACIAKRIVGKDVIVSTGFGGPMGQFSWRVQYDNAAEVEDASSKVMADAEYRSELEYAHGLFIPGSGHDQMWRQI